MAFEMVTGPVLQTVLAAENAPAAATTTGQTTPGTGAAPTPAGDPMQFLYIMIPMVAIMWFVMIRPNQKREKERNEMLSKLAKGDKVVTSSGILGTIVGLSEKSVVLRVSEEPPVKMEFLRAAVSRVAPRDEKDK